MSNPINTIVISNITDDTADKCNFTYYVIVTDEDALHALNAPQEAGKTVVSYEFTNTVSYHPMPYPVAGVTDPAKTSAKYVYSFTAVVKGLECLTERCEVKIISDSVYTVNCINKWIYSWEC